MKWKAGAILLLAEAYPPKKWASYFPEGYYKLIYNSSDVAQNDKFDILVEYLGNDNLTASHVQTYVPFDLVLSGRVLNDEERIVYEIFNS